MNLSESFSVGLGGLGSHKLRTLLTTLGIIFGVSAVISMLSIGEGAKQETLKEIEKMGVNNILIQSTVKEGEDENKSAEERDKEAEDRNRSKGLSLADGEAIKDICPAVKTIAPQKGKKVTVWAGEARTEFRVVGTNPEYAQVLNLRLKEGVFIRQWDFEGSFRVCVLGSVVKRDLFGFRDPIGRKVKIGDQWFTVIGLLEPKGYSSVATATGGLEARSADEEIYIPLTTLLIRYDFKPPYTELDELVVAVRSSDEIRETVNLITSMLTRRHREVEDFKIVVPEELLRQSQRTQRIFNIVMGAIAGISLLVGGIGIMNIMLATVLERTREVGIRRALGARRRDILIQFLIEALLISFVGGMIGIGLGFYMTKAISLYAKWKTIVSPETVILAFGVSAAVGVIFGIYPARKAALLNPIEALRYE